MSPAKQSSGVRHKAPSKGARGLLRGAHRCHNMHYRALQKARICRLFPWPVDISLVAEA